MSKRLVSTACFVLVLVLAVVFASRPVAPNADLWEHAAVGRWIWQHGAFPHETLFLWTASIPWVAHSWLSQLTFFGLLSVGGEEYGPELIRLFTVVMVLLPFVLLWRLWAAHAPVSIWTAFLFSLALYCSEERFNPRPELFSGIGLTCLLLFLLSWSASAPVAQSNGLTRPQVLRAAGLVGLFVLWTNAHGGSVIGLALLGATAGCDMLQDRFDRRSRYLALLTLICTAATCVNPYGPAYWRALNPVGGAMFTSLVEWRPFWAIPAAPLDHVFVLALVLMVAFIAWMRSPRRRLSQVVWLLATTVAYLTARRNSWTLALVSLAVVGAHADYLDPVQLWKAVRGANGDSGEGRRRREKAKPQPAAASTNKAEWLGFAAVILWYGLLLYPPLSELLIPTPLPPRPERVVAFIQDNHLEGRIFNDLEGSSYLQWRLTGRPPLYIDVLNAYPDQLMLDYGDLILFNQRGHSLFEEQNIGCVIFTAYQAVPVMRLPLAQFVAKNPDWALVYQGEDAIIWVKRTAEYEHLWRKESNAQR